MGLDQYLFRRNAEGERTDIFYWRKFNALQKWMYDYYADGEDEQQSLLLDADGMEILKGILQGIVDLANATDSSLLEKCQQDGETELPQKIADYCDSEFPTEEGFFFGSTDYDGYYLQDVASTLEQLEQLTGEWNENEQYYYGSWW